MALDRLKTMLFVDDRTKRLEWAQRNLSISNGIQLTIATNVKEALRLLSARDWDRVSLDHDLTGIDFEDPDTPTCGMEIVRYIEKCGWPTARQKPEFSIHSSNLFAVQLMTTRLKTMGFICWYMPIIYEKTNMAYDEKGIPNG